MHPEIATREQGSQLHPLPEQRASLAIDRAFTEEEFARIRRGFIPERMEDRWLIVMEGDTLSLHRSWTGYCIFQLRFERRGESYAVTEVLANRVEAQYRWTSDEHDVRLALFLVDFLLLGRRSPLPMGMEVPAGLETELHHHHLLGVGPREEPGEIRVTLGGAARWLWRWLRWLARR